MIQFKKILDAWATPALESIFKQEVAELDPGVLPLQHGLTISSQVSEWPVQAMILDLSEDARVVRIKAGIFYRGIVAGCSCADDPTPLAEHNEYCVVQFCIDKHSAEATVTLVAD